MATIGKRIRAARAAAKLSQSQLAQRVGVAQAAISRIERDQTHDPGVLIAAGIARALEITLDQLVEGNTLPRAARKTVETRIAVLERAVEALGHSVEALERSVGTLQQTAAPETAADEG